MSPKTSEDLEIILKPLKFWKKTSKFHFKFLLYMNNGHTLTEPVEIANGLL